MARYAEAIQCLNQIEPERLLDTLKIADARAGLRPFRVCDSALWEIVFSVPDEQFSWFRLVLYGRLQKYERQRSVSQSYRNLRLPRS
jgi:hypothetical protein